MREARLKQNKHTGRGIGLKHFQCLTCSQCRHAYRLTYPVPWFESVSLSALPLRSFSLSFIYLFASPLYTGQLALSLVWPKTCSLASGSPSLNQLSPRPYIFCQSLPSGKSRVQQLLELIKLKELCIASPRRSLYGEISPLRNAVADEVL